MGGTPEQIGPYEVEREIGRGGMGVVWLARDPRLGRSVAIKGLPFHLSDDPDRLARFEREARTLAQLNHPNVASIFGVEEHGGARFLVLEYVEGQTLAERLSEGPLAIDEALEVCAQIAAGVGAAHDAGVVHRDLKPGNVKFTLDGRVKVLDFGLAKTGDGVSGSSIAESASPTLSVPTTPPGPATRPGAVMGTAPYMSPEQARGRAVDKRSDIWSFGVVLYECLTGVCPFAGETMTDSLGAILHREVSWELLPKETPAVVRLLLRRCLQRDRKRRLQDINDARVEIEEAIADPSGTVLDLAGRALAEASSRRGPGLLGALVLALLLGAAGLAAGWWLRPAPAAETLYLAVPTEWDDQFDSDESIIDISSDGLTLAYLAPAPDSTPERRVLAVHVRRLDEPRARFLAGTEHAGSVRLSPDGRHVLFAYYDPDTDREQLRRVSVDGGPTLTLIDDRTGDLYSMDSTAWRSDDEIVLFDEPHERIVRVPASGGAVLESVDVPLEEPWDFATDPVPIPGTRWVLCTRLDFGSAGVRTSIYALDLESGEGREVIADGAFAKLVGADHIAFTRGSTLCAAPFDRKKIELTGPVAPVLTGLYSWESFPSPAFAVSEAGHLGYVVGTSNVGERRLVTMDRRGEVEQLVDTTRHYAGSLALSPDGERLALTMMDEGGLPQVAVLEIATGFLQPISRSEHPSMIPSWTPDGRVVFTQWQSQQFAELVVVDPGVSGEPVKLAPIPEGGQGAQWGPTFTPDGRFMVYYLRESGEDGGDGLYIVPLDGSAEPRALKATGHEEGPALSPDGKWLAYSTDASGRDQVVLCSFDPERGVGTRVHPVSYDGGIMPFWSRDGATLFFQDSFLGDVMGASITTEPALRISPPEKVLEGDLMHMAGWGGRMVVVTPDGERFIFVQEPEGRATPTHINFVLNWVESLDSAR